MGALLNQGILNDLENPTEFMKQPDFPQQRFQGLHHMFVASALAVKMAHEIDPEYKVGRVKNKVDFWAHLYKGSEKP